MISLVKGNSDIYVHRIPMVDVTPERHQSYGIKAQSAYVYDTNRSSYPTRIESWSNVNRPNPRNGQPVRYGDYGPIDGGDGQYLDPSNKATDAEMTWYLSTESMAITANGTNTGTIASGQVYAPDQVRKIRHGDVVILDYGDGCWSAHTVDLHSRGNGHGSLSAPYRVGTPWNEFDVIAMRVKAAHSV